VLTTNEALVLLSFHTNVTPFWDVAVSVCVGTAQVSVAGVFIDTVGGVVFCTTVTEALAVQPDACVTVTL
jgi:hypothetical protein